MGGGAVAARRITAVMVDDHDVVVAGVRAWCAEAVPPIDLVDASPRLAAAWTGPGATADVVILDLGLDGPVRSDGSPDLGPLQRLVEAGRRVVVFTAYPRDDVATRCITIGALAYVTKAEGRQHLVDAVHRAAEDRATVPPLLGGAMVADDDPDRPRLTAQEIAVLRAWFASSSQARAARQLGLAKKTVETYIGRARVRYALVGRPAPSKTALVTRALEDGLITIDELRQMQAEHPDR